MVSRAGAMSAGVDCFGGVPFTDDDELERALALGGIGLSSSSSSSITIGELRDPIPTIAMTGEVEKELSVSLGACPAF